MKGILILSHGSREQKAQADFEAILQALRQQLPQYAIAGACLQFSAQTLGDGLDKLVKQGKTAIHIVPYFLFDGVHTLENIPQQVAQYCTLHPQVSITVGKPLGVDKKLVELLQTRIERGL